ncbi:hypothetical protein D8T52_00760 [Vibrio vulnificus]|uniref:hypothetical protein n=1 Tax=Vibrio vulnificus TaxID=672 RepID=UPI001029645C|nr:hypothetical protein [Vibrio vulnificus]RZP84198.1 hypothetical protein D8T52_00760 [Vibrio vulnificus]
MIAQTKIVLGAASLAVASLGMTYVSLTPGSSADDLLSVSTYQSKLDADQPQAPSGNIFKVDRVIRAVDADKQAELDAAAQAAEAARSAKATLGDFVMVSIVTQGERTYAVFVGKEQRIALAEGEFNDAIGTLSSIKGNQATTTDVDGAEKHWRLFPVGDLTPKEESPNQEETTTQ